jgi:dUTP pyrophosphatase
MSVEKLVISVEEGAVAPSYATSGSAGADIRAFTDKPIYLFGGSHHIVNTGLRMRVPEGYEVQIRPRSGLAAKNVITVLNSPGTIDSDYRGEVRVILVNHGNEGFVIRNGDKIAQMVLAPVTRAEFVIGEVDVDTERGTGGFGSTGIQ